MRMKKCVSAVRRIGKRFVSVRLTIPCLLLFPPMISAQTIPSCPPGQGHLATSVQVAVQKDSSSNLYIYRYTVTNSSESTLSISEFSVSVLHPPVMKFTAPKGWTAFLVSAGAMVMWQANRWAKTAPSDSTQTRAFPPDALKPGATLSGFSFTSPHPPGPADYYVLGPLPDEDDHDDSKPPPTEGCYPDIAGGTLGPTDFLTVQLVLNPGKNPNVIDLQKDETLKLCILGTQRFHPFSVDTRFFTFGGKYPPVVKGSHLEDVNGDGIPDLVLEFNVKDLQLSCNRTALTFSGMSKDSNFAVYGSLPVLITGCRPPYQSGH